ncbi:hypothetical protein KAT51_08635 [bacterium]|nr:hypothetical protein [bacterium]
MKNKQYIKIYSYSLIELIKEGHVCPAGVTGLFRTIIYIRCRKTKVIEGFYGQICFFEEDSAEERMDRLQMAIDEMMRALKESNAFKDDNYGVRNHLTGKWEQVRL